MVKIKICGLRDAGLVRRTAAAGADWIGLVFAPASPRAVKPAEASALVAATGAATPVALLVDADDALVDAVRALGITILQLHGRESPERVAEIKARSGAEVWKAHGIASPSDLARLTAYDAADRFLLDARPPEGSARTGGHGAAFDWSLLTDWTAPKPWLLAGGLTPDNVAGAIAATGAEAVDVSSGVETAPGIKDMGLIRAFIEAVRNQQQP